MNRKRAQVDLLVLVSDNESWRDTRGSRETATMREWAALKARCPQAQLVCIDLQPVSSSQTVEREDVLHIGGFSDAVFDVVASFAEGKLGAQHWVGEIEQIVIEAQ